MNELDKSSAKFVRIFCAHSGYTAVDLAKILKVFLMVQTFSMFLGNYLM